MPAPSSYNIPLRSESRELPRGPRSHACSAARLSKSKPHDPTLDHSLRAPPQTRALCKMSGLFPSERHSDGIPITHVSQHYPVLPSPWCRPSHLSQRIGTLLQTFPPRPFTRFLFFRNKMRTKKKKKLARRFSERDIHFLRGVFLPSWPPPSLLFPSNGC